MPREHGVYPDRDGLMRPGIDRSRPPTCRDVPDLSEISGARCERSHSAPSLFPVKVAAEAACIW